MSATDAPRPALLLLAALAAAFAGSGAAGCLEREPVGDVGAPDLATVQSRIFSTRCAFADCHGGPTPRLGQNLEPGRTVGSVVGVTSVQAPPRLRVAPGDASRSYLIDKLRGTQLEVGGAGERMPLGATPLSDAEIALVAAWIDGLPLAAPVVMSITPAAAPTGAVVRIAGEHFAEAEGGNVVTFGGVAAAVTAGSATLLEVTVPAGLAAGPSAVIVAVDDQASNALAFAVAPAVVAVVPDTSVAGATVAVHGAGFGGSRGASRVSFGGADALAYGAWTDERIDVLVPAGTTSGDVTVTVAGVASAAVPFFVVTPTLSSLQAAVFDRRCGLCHGVANGPPTKAMDCPPGASSGSLDLRAGMTHAALVGVDSCELPGTARVVPGDRATSWLYLKLTWAHPPVGQQMPRDGAPLPWEVQDAVGRWIDLGALDD